MRIFIYAYMVYICMWFIFIWQVTPPRYRDYITPLQLVSDPAGMDS